MKKLIITLLSVVLIFTEFASIPFRADKGPETGMGYNPDEGRYQQPGESTPYKQYEPGRPSTVFQTQEGFYKQGDGSVRLRQSEEVSHAPGYRNRKFPKGDPRAQVSPLPTSIETSAGIAQNLTNPSFSDGPNRRFLEDQRTLGNVPFETAGYPTPTTARRG